MFKFFSRPKPEFFPLTPEERRTILLYGLADDFFGYPPGSPFRGFFFMAYDEDGFPDADYLPLLTDVVARLCRPYQAVNHAAANWSGPSGRRRRQAVSPIGAGLHRLAAQRAGTPAYSRTVWVRREGYAQDHFYSLTQGADMDLVHLLYDGLSTARLILHDVYCYRYCPFRSTGADDLAAGIKACPPELLLSYDAPIHRLYLTADTRSVDLAWVRRELEAACRVRGLPFEVVPGASSQNL